MPEEVWVRRCGEELDEVRRRIQELVVNHALIQKLSHECNMHREEESCEAHRKAVMVPVEANLEKAFDDLAKCLGRIAHE
jgi:hypothetical protein